VSSAVNSPLVGELIDGRYRVREYIAEGGMATVYLATDTRLERDVALKVMRPHLADDEVFVSRFRREAQSAARLSHPHVVSVHDQGEDASRVFLTMEYVRGRTLRQVLDTHGALNPRASLDVLDPILEALGAAHRAGYIHRDVKPENVIIREDGVVKVADFGLARAVSAHTSTTGVVLGTVAYLSPEQVERGVADARSDVYAAGLLLFEMLTGRQAFSGESPIHVAYQHVHGAVPAPSRIVSSVPPDLDALVARATARDPDARPADAAAFLEEVRAVRGRLSQAALDARPETAAAAAAAASVPTRTTVLAREPGPAGGANHTSVVAAPPRDDTRRRPRRRMPAWVLVPLVIILGVVTAGWWFLSGPGAPATVPAVVGMSYDDATSALSDAHLDATRENAFSEKVKKGLVVSTKPGEGAEVRRGSTVTVTVSRGPERHAVPDVTGSSLRDARAAVLDEKLKVGKVSRAFDDSVPEGEVVSSDPQAGTKLKRNAAVSLVVSKGPHPLDVPDVTGQEFKDAEQILEGLGLNVEKGEKVYSTTVEKDRVAAQRPSDGNLFPGDTITLDISKGAEMAKVPDVGSMREDQARQVLEDAGFQVEVRKFLGGFFGTVRSQDPRAGEKAPEGSIVTISIF
jgi:beta-lactam-binding protein with PASTA domain/tRNA A-37 threonylcarbamoyl transferase component Bud32